MDIRVLFAGSLQALLAAIGAPAVEDDAAAAARAVLAAAAPGQPGHARLRSALKLGKEEARRLLFELETYLAHDTRPAAQKTPTSQRNAEIAMLRVLSWFETAHANGAPLQAPRGGKAREDRGDAYRLVSTLELVMRELLRHLHPGEEALRQRLERALPAEARDAIKRSPEDPVAGLFLKDLVRLYVDAEEWARLKPLYQPSPLLRLLDEQRITAERFLEDVRRIRNDVAHVKELSAVQHALLVRYHDELVDPVRDAWREGATTVNPSRFEADKGRLSDEELQRMEDRIAAESRRGSARSFRVAVAALSLSLLLGMLSTPAWWPALRLWFDPDLAFLDTLARDRRQFGSLAVQACELDRLQALTRLAAQPGAAGALAGPDQPALHARIVALAVQQPARASACIPTLAAMGWRADVVDGNTLSQVYGGRPPPGFARFAQDHPAGLVPGRTVPPEELRCPLLVLAVWQREALLVTALRAAGAGAEVPCLLDAAWTDGRVDQPLTSAREEATRAGDAAILAAIGD